MKTKADLLEAMANHEACEEATDYVTDHPSDSAEEIGLSCGGVDWLIWFLVRERVDITDFVRGCAKSAEGYASTYAAAAYAARYAANAAYAAANAAAYAAADAADADADAAAYAAYAAERKIQLEQLHNLWKEWCRS